MLLSSHILSEVEKACDRVSIVRAGRIVDTGSLAELRHLTPHPGARRADPHPTPDEVRYWPGTHDVAVDGAEVRFSVDTEHLGRGSSRPWATGASRASPASRPPSRSCSSPGTRRAGTDPRPRATAPASTA